MLYIRFNSLFYVTTFLLLVLTTSCFSYVYWDPTLGGQILRCFDFVFIFLCFHNKRKNVNANFEREVNWIFKLAFLSVIGNTFLYHQSPMQNVINTCSHAFILYYFLLHFYGIKEKIIIAILTILVLMILFIQLVQQFTFPIAPFGINIQAETTNNLIEIRNGLFRFRIETACFAMLLVFFCWEQLLKKIRLWAIILFVLSLTSIYLFLTRQIIITVLFSIFLSAFLVKNRRLKIWTMCLLAVLCVIFYNWGNLFFEELIESSRDETDNDNVRIHSAFFFIDKILANPISFFLGNGSPKEAVNWGLKEGFWISDVGFIGECFIYGFFYIAVYPIILWKVYKYRNCVPLYIKMYIISTFLISVMIFPYRTRVEFMIWSMVLYICDLHINNSKLKYQ